MCMIRNILTFYITLFVSHFLLYITRINITKKTFCKSTGEDAILLISMFITTQRSEVKGITVHNGYEVYPLDLINIYLQLFHKTDVIHACECISVLLIPL